MLNWMLVRITDINFTALVDTTRSLILLIQHCIIVGLLRWVKNVYKALCEKKVVMEEQLFPIKPYKLYAYAHLLLLYSYVWIKIPHKILMVKHCLIYASYILTHKARYQMQLSNQLVTSIIIMCGVKCISFQRNKYMVKYSLIMYLTMYFLFNHIYMVKQ